MKQDVKKPEIFSRISHDLMAIIIAQTGILKKVMASSFNAINKTDYDMIDLTCNSCANTLRILEAYEIYQQKENKEKLELDYQKFNIIEILKNILKEHKTLFKYCNLKIKVDFSKEIIIRADKYMIKRALERLVNYCANHAYSNSIMEIICHKIGHEIMFKIKILSDYVKEETIKDIFNLNFTQDVTIKTSFALELFAIKEIIVAHYGRIIAESLKDDILNLGFYMPMI